MQLTKAINILLYTNDCVTVPEFGSFIINKFSSIYDENKGKILSTIKKSFF